MRSVCAASIFALLASGCLSGVKVHEPTTARPAPVAPVARNNGAIFQEGVSYRPLFEDRRARYVGDTLNVTINEKTAASNQNDAAASRDAKVNFGIPTVQNLPIKTVQGATLEANAASNLQAKEQTSANNLFSGAIAVTVIDVLPNGNLMVAGEKRTGVNNEIETLRLSGIVNPMHIVNGNIVSSVHIADARIEVGSHSTVKPQQVLGFLGRFFLSFMPFR